MRKITSTLLIILNVFLLSACALGAEADGRLTGSDFNPVATHSEEQTDPDTPPTIDELNKLDEVLALLDNDYESRGHSTYYNINGKTVDLYSFFVAL